MARLFLMNLCFCLGFAPVFSQSKHDVAERKIKSVTVQTEDLKKGKMVTESVISRFDADGNEVETREFDADSSLVKWEKRAFNKHGDRTLYEDLDPKTGTVLKRITTTFNRHDDLTERIETDMNGTITEREVTEYNHFFEKTSETTFDGTAKMKRKTEYTYDPRGMPLSRKTTNAEGKITFSRTYQYEY